MAINQIGYFGQGAALRIANFIQNPGQFSVGNTLGNWGSSTIAQTYGGVFEIGLPGATYSLIPEGQWLTQAGVYSDLQYWDAQSQMWRNLAMSADVAPIPISSDGTNWRFSNTTGTPVGAVVTNAGTAGSLPVSMYTPLGVWTSGTFTAQASPTVTAVSSAGGAGWNTFIGGAVNTSVTITAGGTLYTSAPKIVVLPPTSQGTQPFIPATAVCTISGGVVNAVTITNQGAGYVAAPTLLVLNQPGDTTGSGAVLTPTLTGTGQVTAVVMPGITLGTIQTSAITITMGGASLPASAAASPIMNWTLTTAAAGTVTAGSGYTNGYNLYAIGGNSTATPIYTNPAIEKGIVIPTQPTITSSSTTVLGLNSASSIMMFGGTGYQVVPSALVPINGLGSLGVITAPPVGAQNDTCLLYPI